MNEMDEGIDVNAIDERSYKLAMARRVGVLVLAAFAMLMFASVRGCEHAYRYGGSDSYWKGRAVECKRLTESGR